MPYIELVAAWLGWILPAASANLSLSQEQNLFVGAHMPGLFGSSLCMFDDRDNDGTCDVLISDFFPSAATPKALIPKGESVIGWLVSGSNGSLIGRIATHGFCPMARGAYRLCEDLNGDGVRETAIIGVDRSSKISDIHAHCLLVVDGLSLKVLQRVNIPKPPGTDTARSRHVNVPSDAASTELCVATTYGSHPTTATRLTIVTFVDALKPAHVRVERVIRGVWPVSIIGSLGGRSSILYGVSTRSGGLPSQARWWQLPGSTIGEEGGGRIFALHWQNAETNPYGSGVLPGIIAIREVAKSGALCLQLFQPDSLDVTLQRHVFASAGSDSHVQGLFGPCTEAQGFVCTGGDGFSVAFMESGKRWEPAIVAFPGEIGLVTGYGYTAIGLKTVGAAKTISVVISAYNPNPYLISNGVYWVDPVESSLRFRVFRSDLLED